METQEKTITSREVFDFRFFYPLINLKSKLTPMQRNAFEFLHDKGGKIICWPNGLRTFTILEKKGVPLKFTELPPDTPFTDDRTLVELVYPNSL